MIGTIKTVNISSFYGRELTKVDLGEYVLRLSFGEGYRIDVEDYWEYIDKDLKLIDRYYSSKFRKEFLLPELVNCKVIGSSKEDSHVALLFDNSARILISVLNDVQQLDIYTHFKNRRGLEKFYENN
ncbi:MAG: hypothetical protein HQL15_09400 [Candidatus Omnitrophica bacterium]|nr:hypothetical protein [Candidatus Omnitrophota bacterium]